MSPKPPFSALLLAWYDRHGRTNLPWRQNINAYRVWVSEIMLQQTQVSTVIPYFQRFMQTFPSVATLAAADQDNVLHHWTGLGYYARGRNLHKSAQLICSDHGGELPDDPHALEALPGIGRSTAGAICAIAFNRRAPILDGNVKRVLARYHRVEGWPGQSAVQKKLWQLADDTTPRQRSADYTQAIMDLGATVCTRRQPQCSICPLSNDCSAFRHGVTDQFPASRPRKKLPVRTRFLLVLSNRSGEILLYQRPPNGLWGGLWSFPECDTESRIEPTCSAMGLSPKQYRYGQQNRHTFSHYHLDYTPVYIAVDPQHQIADTPTIWVDAQNPGPLGLPRPIEKILSNMP